jgi:hypothetical protein
MQDLCQMVLHNKEKQLYREFFTLEKNPKLQKPISSSKSSKKTIFEKLKEITDIADKVENNKFISKESSQENDNADNNHGNNIKIKMPTGFGVHIFRDAEHLVYDIKKDNTRYNLRMKINKNKDFEEEFQRFTEKLKDKYPELEF